jgi:hypothetical protein
MGVATPEAELADKAHRIIKAEPKPADDVLAERLQAHTGYKATAFIAKRPRPADL